jgi:hypothetical protein
VHIFYTIIAAVTVLDLCLIVLILSNIGESLQGLEKTLREAAPLVDPVASAISAHMTHAQKGR